MCIQEGRESSITAALSFKTSSHCPPVTAVLLQVSGALDMTNCSSDEWLEDRRGFLMLEHVEVLFENKSLGSKPVKYETKLLGTEAR